MKLLGLRLDDHDTNMCLYDNGKLSYIKTERIYQIKHHAYNNADQWVVDLKRIFGLTPEDIDEIAIVADPLRYGVNQFFDFDVKKYEKLENAECPVFHIEHHLAHALSANMINKTDYQFVFDAKRMIQRLCNGSRQHRGALSRVHVTDQDSFGLYC